MEELFEKRLAFLNDTVEFYSSDTTRRGIKEDKTCRYRTEDGKKCAIGRHIPDHLYKPAMEGSYNGNWRVQEAIPINIKDLGESFLSAVQGLHDFCQNWNREGITEAGKNVVNHIKGTFCTIK